MQKWQVGKKVKKKIIEIKLHLIKKLHHQKEGRKKKEKKGDLDQKQQKTYPNVASKHHQQTSITGVQ